MKDPYGLDDLYYSVVVKGIPEGSVDIAVKDFISYMKFLDQNTSKFQTGLCYKEYLEGNFEPATREFISSLVSFEYSNFWWMFDFRTDSFRWFMRCLIRKTFNKIMKILRIKFRLNMRIEEKSYFVNVSEQKFLELSRTYIDNIFTPLASKYSASHVVLDQAVPMINYKNEMRFFRKAKLIVVDRDPRDIYADLVELNSWFKDLAKTRDTSKYVELHNAARKNQQELKEDPDVLFLRFEDLIYHYDESLKRIADFAGLDLKDHARPRENFNPDVSIKNVGLWHSVITEKESKAIAAELGDYLYIRN